MNAAGGQLRAESLPTEVTVSFHFLTLAVVEFLPKEPFFLIGINLIPTLVLGQKTSHCLRFLNDKLDYILVP